MNLGNITILTPPDKIFNLNISYLLVSPSMTVKQQFQTILSKIPDAINVFMYESDETDIDWLLSVGMMADVVIIDIDNCNQITKTFISVLLAQPNVHYITTDEITPYGLVSKNRIYNLDWIVENIDDIIDEDNDDNQSED
jgi:hypothetical protein